MVLMTFSSLAITLVPVRNLSDDVKLLLEGSHDYFHCEDGR